MEAVGKYVNSSNNYGKFGGSFIKAEGFGKKCDLVTLNPYFCRGEYWRILAPGRYRLRASLYGSDYATAWKDVEVGPGLQPRVDFVMEKARLSGSSNNLKCFFKI